MIARCLEVEFKRLCEELDKVLRLDLGFRGIVDDLYSASRSITGRPLVQAFVEAIEVSRPSHVMIVTGFKVMPKATQETDGPPGALVLAKTLVELGFNVSLAIEEDAVEVLKAGLEVLDLKCHVHGLPINASLSDLALRLIKEFKPSVLVFVEKAGANDVGVYHTTFGIDVTKYHAKVEVLLEEAKKVGCRIIAIGDCGNEVGFGSIGDVVKRLIPQGRDCGCPCRRGIAASSRADVVVASSISNIGCYAASCALSAFNGVSWLHNHDLELKLLKSMVDVGAVDGISGEGCMKVDGVPAEVLASLVDVLSHIVEEYLRMKTL